MFSVTISSENQSEDTVPLTTEYQRGRLDAPRGRPSVPDQRRATMSTLSIIQKTITAVLVVTAAALVIGQVLGQPLLIGYVETGSMVPTLQVGDGFIAIPTALAGDVGEGTVVTYEAQTLGGGGLTTHRVVRETENGYITKGDGNPFTDQDNGEPPVQDPQIVAVALQINGELVVLPSLGNAALAVQQIVRAAISRVGGDSIGGVGVTTTGVGVVLIVGSLLYGLFESEGRSPERSTSRDGMISGWLVLGGIILVLGLPVMTSMVVPTETSTARILSMESPDPTNPVQVEVGGSSELSYGIENSFYLTKVVILEAPSPGVEFSDTVITVERGETASVTQTLYAPNETGTYARSRSEYHYIQVLPVSVIEGLHSIHPYVAMSVITFLLISPVVGLYLLVFGLQPIAIRSVHD